MSLRTDNSTIDIYSFPHIFDLIVWYVHAADDVATLSSLRACGHAAKRTVDKRVATHVVVAGSRPCSRYYSVWTPQLTRHNRAVRTMDILKYDDEGALYADGACAVFLRTARPRFLRVYGQRALPLAPSVRALIQIFSCTNPLESTLVLVPKLHNVFCFDAQTAANLTSFNIEPCGQSHVTISLLPFFSVGRTPQDMVLVFTTLNDVIRWAEDQLTLNPELTIAFLGLEKSKCGFAFQADWNAMIHEDKVLQWFETVMFDMRVDFADRFAFVSHPQFREVYGEELHRLVVDT